MKRIISLLIFALIVYSCSSINSKASKPLYETLTINNNGGANIKFYEVLTESKEIMMLLGDETLRKKIKADDIIKSSFIILNAGPTNEKLNKITIEKVIETPTQIEVYINDTQKNITEDQSNDDTNRPYTIVKINSKKPIITK
jgi:hypothetical protein